MRLGEAPCGVRLPPRGVRLCKRRAACTPAPPPLPPPATAPLRPRQRERSPATRRDERDGDGMERRASECRRSVAAGPACLPGPRQTAAHPSPHCPCPIAGTSTGATQASTQFGRREQNPSAITPHARAGAVLASTVPSARLYCTFRAARAPDPGRRGATRAPCARPDAQRRGYPGPRRAADTEDSQHMRQPTERRRWRATVPQATQSGLADPIAYVESIRRDARMLSSMSKASAGMRKHPPERPLNPPAIWQAGRDLRARAAARPMALAAAGRC